MACLFLLQGCSSFGQAAGSATHARANLGGELLARLDHPVLAVRQRCPITRSNVGTVRPPAGLRSVLVGDLRGVYGQGSLWAILPTWRHTVTRDPHHGWYRMKVAWWSQVSGPLQIAARRIDRHSAILGHGDVAPGAPSGAHRIEPTNIVFPTLGCWQVAGAVGHHVLSWIFHART